MFSLTMIDETRRRLLAMGAGVVSTCDAIAAERLRDKPAAALCGSGVVQPSRPDGVHTGGSRTVRIDGRFDVLVKQVGTGAAGGTYADSIHGPSLSRDVFGHV
jgi:hypothetical protein